MTEPDDHNAAHFLVVRYIPTTNGPFPPGWYVVRTCPCYFGEPCTMPLQSLVDADRAKAAMLSVAS